MDLCQQHLGYRAFYIQLCILHLFEQTNFIAIKEYFISDLSALATFPLLNSKLEVKRKLLTCKLFYGA